MVKIRVVGDETFEWIQGKNVGISGVDDPCAKQSTFYEHCFDNGTPVLDSSYLSVELATEVESGIKYPYNGQTNFNEIYI